MTIYTLRNMVERCFNKLKNSHRLATRYGKTADSFLEFVDVACIGLWLCHLSTWPNLVGRGRLGCLRSLSAKLCPSLVAGFAYGRAKLYDCARKPGFGTGL